MISIPPGGRSGRSEVGEDLRKGLPMVSMTDAKSQQVGKWAIIVGAMVLIGALVFDVRSAVNDRPDDAAGRHGGSPVAARRAVLPHRLDWFRAISPGG